MIIEIALIISILLQFGAFFVIISLIPKTKMKISWIMISVAFLLMAIRRLSEFIFLQSGNFNSASTAINNWVAVSISVLMFIASIYIRQLFKIQNKINKLRKENEAKVLSAIIKTEEKERQRFAKELHDGLGPILSSIKMTISAIDKTDISNTNEQIINNTEQAIDNAIVTVKEISNNLSPHILERFRLEKAIRNFTNSIITKENIDIVLSSNLEEKRFDYNIEVVLYRIICELINNTLKYASASKIEIWLHANTEIIEMDYSDNGVGFDINANKNSGMGLSNIASRIKSLEGEISIKTKINQGFFLKTVLPIWQKN